MSAVWWVGLALATVVGLAAAVPGQAAAPPERVGYVLCVTRDGGLILGEQVSTLESGRERAVFAWGTSPRVPAPRAPRRLDVARRDPGESGG